MRKMLAWSVVLGVAATVTWVQAQPRAASPRPGRAPLQPGKAPSAAQVAKNQEVVLNARRLWTSTAWLDPLKMSVSASRNRMTSLRGQSRDSGAILGLTIYKGFRYDVECGWDWPDKDGSMRFNARFIRGGDVTVPVQRTLRTLKFSLSPQARTTRDARIELKATASEPWVLKSCKVKRTRS